MEWPDKLQRLLRPYGAKKTFARKMRIPYRTLMNLLTLGQRPREEMAFTKRAAAAVDPPVDVEWFRNPDSEFPAVPAMPRGSDPLRNLAAGEPALEPLIRVAADPKLLPLLLDFARRLLARDGPPASPAKPRATRR